MIPKGIPVLFISGWVDWMSSAWLSITFPLVFPSAVRYKSLLQKRDFYLCRLHQLLMGCPSRLLFPLPSFLLPVNGKSPETICEALWLRMCAFISRHRIHSFHQILKVVYKAKKMSKPSSPHMLFTIPQKCSFSWSDAWLGLFTLPTPFHSSVIASSFLSAPIFLFGPPFGTITIFFLTSIFLHVLLILPSRLRIPWELELLFHFYSLWSIYLILLTLTPHQLCGTSLF